ncbi:MAG: J domain-containing protein [Coleofasciculaceae cyanobacterium SM2_1_6]|nr:J domain-containing protein [Coleofasciculaceae cyanobacterium SM2_1_6]
MSDQKQQQINQSLGNPVSYYTLLELPVSASPTEIRRSYRELSKRYHPDTTILPPEVATANFLQINEAYATLSNPERRSLYDQSLKYSRSNFFQSPLFQSDPSSPINKPADPPKPFRSSAYLDPSDRPLSSGEISALLFLGLALLGCLILAIGIGLTRGETAVLIRDQAIEKNMPRSSRLSSQSSQPLQSPLQSKQAIFNFPTQFQDYFFHLP